MPFQFQKISNYGTSTPAVARTLVQGSELMQAFPLDDAVKEGLKEILFDLQRQLLRCFQIRERIEEEVEVGLKEVDAKGLDVQSRGQAVNLPSVADLQSHAESFLQSAKLGVRDCARLLKPFFGKEFDHRFHRIVSWSEQQMGAENGLTKCAAHWESWVKRLVDMRNAVDHPRNEPGGSLVTYNFRLVQTPKGWDISPPCWGLSGETPALILPDMEYTIEWILQLSEDLLAICLLRNRGGLPIYIYEIPEKERDKSCPIRLRVGVNLPSA